jgi:hypothetical protein
MEKRDFFIAQALTSILSDYTEVAYAVFGRRLGISVVIAGTGGFGRAIFD